VQGQPFIDDERQTNKSAAIKSIIIWTKTWTKSIENTTEQLWVKIFVSGVTVNISDEVFLFLKTEL
jgi:hypothetical protein